MTKHFTETQWLLEYRQIHISCVMKELVVPILLFTNETAMGIQEIDAANFRIVQIVDEKSERRKLKARVSNTFVSTELRDCSPNGIYMR